MRNMHSTFICALALALSAPALTVKAEELPPPLAKEYKAAVARENAGDVLGALAMFEGIVVKKRDPNALLHVAGCKAKLNRLLEAEADYDSLARDPASDAATVETAVSNRNDVSARIPKLVLSTTPATTRIEVKVDGVVRAVPATLR